MKATGLQGRPTSPSQESFARYLALSAVVHAVAVLGLLGGMWFGTPSYYKPSSYTVSLVDAPVTLRPAALTGGGEKPAEAPSKPPEPGTLPQETPQPPPKPPAPAPMTAAPEEKPKPVAAPEPAPEKKPEPAPEKKPKPVAAPEPTPEKKPKAVPKKPEPTVAQRKSAPPEESAAVAAAKAQEAVKRLRQQEAVKAQATMQAEQAKQRVAALRERYDTGMGEGGSGREATAGLHEVRLRAYQELIREQIIDAWILPLPEAEAQKLQATALLTVDRSGHITKLQLLKPSGNVLFDESLLRAIKQAAPLPALPNEYVGEFLDVEMRFRVGDA